MTAHLWRIAVVGRRINRGSWKTRDDVCAACRRADASTAMQISPSVEAHVSIRHVARQQPQHQQHGNGHLPPDTCPHPRKLRLWISARLPLIDVRIMEWY